MNFINLKGYKKNVNISKYKIQWEGGSLSKYQKHVKDFLRPYWFAHIVCEEFTIPGSRLRIDILNLTKNIALEIDGEQHGDANHFFHGGNKLNYIKQFSRDSEKQKWCSMNNINLIRITPEDFPITYNFFKELDIIL